MISRLHMLFRSFTVAAAALALFAFASSTAFSQRMLTISEPFVMFGSVAVGSQTDRPVTITNISSQDVIIVSKSLEGSTPMPFQFIFNANLPLTLAAGQSVTMLVRFAPQTVGPKSAKATIVTEPANQAEDMAVTGLAGLSFSPGSIDFGDVKIHTTSTLAFTVTNNGNASAQIVSARADADPKIYTVTGTFPYTLQAGSTVTFSVNCTPLDLGGVDGMLVIGTGAQGMVIKTDTIWLTSNGIQKMVRSSDGSGLVVSLPKGQKNNINVGGNNTYKYNLSNSGSSDMVVESANVLNASADIFSIDNSFPITVKPGTTEALNILCKAKVSGEFTANVNIVTTDAGSGMVPLKVAASVPSGVTDEITTTLNVYPNPVVNVAHFNLDGTSNRIEIVNSIGKVVNSFDTRSATSFEWNCTDANNLKVSTGVYFLRVQGTKGNYTVPFVIGD